MIDTPAMILSLSSQLKAALNITAANIGTIIYVLLTHAIYRVRHTKNIISLSISLSTFKTRIFKGTNEELKRMINTGERLEVEIYRTDDRILKDVKNLPNIISAEFHDNFLAAKSGSGKNNLIGLIDYLKSNKIPFGKVYSEPPTLNDVFLEITGKELRD